eukprot:gene872-1697_t
MSTSSTTISTADFPQTTSVIQSLESHAAKLEKDLSHALGVDITTEDYEKDFLLKYHVSDRDTLKLRISGVDIQDPSIYKQLRDEIYKNCPELLHPGTSSDEASLWFRIIASVSKDCDRKELETRTIRLRENAEKSQVNGFYDCTMVESFTFEANTDTKKTIPLISQKLCQDLGRIVFNKCKALSTEDPPRISGEYFNFWQDLLGFATKFLMKNDGTLTLLRTDNIHISLENLSDDQNLSPNQIDILMGFLEARIKEWKLLLSSKDKKSKDKKPDFIQRELDTELFFDTMCKVEVEVQNEVQDEVVKTGDEVVSGNLHSSREKNVALGNECINGLNDTNKNKKRTIILSLGNRHKDCALELEKFRYNVIMVRGFKQLSNKILRQFKEKGKIVTIPKNSAVAEGFQVQGILSTNGRGANNMSMIIECPSDNTATTVTTNDTTTNTVTGFDSDTNTSTTVAMDSTDTTSTSTTNNTVVMNMNTNNNNNNVVVVATGAEVNLEKEVTERPTKRSEPSTTTSNNNIITPVVSGSVAVSESGSVSLPMSGSLSVSGSLFGSIPLSGSLFKSAPGSGLLLGSVSAAGSLPVPVSGSGSLPASGSLPVSKSGSASIFGSQPESGYGSGSLPVSGSGSLPVSGSGSGSLPVSGSGSLPVSGSGTLPVSGSGTLPVSGSGTLPVSGSVSLPVSGSGTLPVSGSGTLSVSGSGTLPVSGSGSLPISGSGSLPVSGSGSLPVSGSGSLPVSGSGSLPVSGSVSLPVSGSGSLPVSGSGTLPVSGSGSLPVSGSGSLPVSGSASVSKSGIPGTKAQITNVIEIQDDPEEMCAVAAVCPRSLDVEEQEIRRAVDENTLDVTDDGELSLFMTSECGWTCKQINLPNLKQ